MIHQHKTEKKPIALVLGASGFLGSHVTRELVKQGYTVRIFTRPTSNTVQTDNLNIERMQGDILNYDQVCDAMQGCDFAFHCVVDTRAWLRNPAPLYRVNIDGLTNSLNAALETGIKRFIMTSSYVTIGKRVNGLSTEENEFTWNGRVPAYIQSRLEGEKLLFDYYKNKGLNGVACCVGNTYGEGDVQPTPHGKMIRDVITGRLPFYWEGGGPTVNIRDAARGMILAAEKGRAGERYILAGPYVLYKDLFRMAAEAAGKRPPKIKIPLSLLYAMGFIAECITRPFGIENKLNRVSIQCSTLMPDVSSAKAQHELGWRPGTPQQAVLEAVQWYENH